MYRHPSPLCPIIIPINTLNLAADAVNIVSILSNPLKYQQPEVAHQQIHLSVPDQHESHHAQGDTDISFNQIIVSYVTSVAETMNEAAMSVFKACYRDSPSAGPRDFQHLSASYGY